MKKKISGVKKKQKKIGHRTFYFLSPEAWVDIIPNRVRVGNFIYRGIIDLRDPSGKYLVLLYANLPGGGGKGREKYCHESGETFTCIRSTITYTNSSFLAWPVITLFMHLERDQYISTLFPAFNHQVWMVLRGRLNLNNRLWWTLRWNCT